MPVTLQWLEEGHILEYRMVGRVTAVEMRQALEEEKQFYGATENTVHVLLDVSELVGPPGNPIAITRHSALMTPQRGHLAYVGASATVRTITDILSRFSGRRDHSFHETRESAIARLRQAVAEEADG